MGRMLSSSSLSSICQTTDPKSLPKRFLHTVQSRASSFNWQYPLLSLRSSSSILRLLPRLLVTSICPFILPSITCCRRQFLRKMWPIQLAFRFLISCRIFLCFIFHMIGPTDLHPSPVPHFKTFQAFLIFVCTAWKCNITRLKNSDDRRWKVRTVFVFLCAEVVLLLMPQKRRPLWSQGQRGGISSDEYATFLATNTHPSVEAV